MTARDPLYEDATGRRASPEAVRLRRWIHQRFLADPEALPGRLRYYEAVMDPASGITKHAAVTVMSSAGGVTVTKGDRLWKDALMWVRERGLVDDAWIVDRTRRIYDYSGYPSVFGGVDAVLDSITIDPWDADWPLLAIESEASAAALEPVVAEYRTLMAPLRGQAGRAYLFNEVAPQLHDGQIVLAVVDLDKVGDDISESARKRLEAQTGFTFDWRVIALTDEQVEDYGIVRVPRVDGREKDGPTRMVAETEALGADNLRAIVRAEMDALLPRSLVSVRERERAQRDEVRGLLGLTGE